jgi:SAM-dependent methyltransferase
MNETQKREAARKSHKNSPFSEDKFSQFIVAPGLDIGFGGGNFGTGGYKPAFDFIGIDQNFPDYDGVHLPFPDDMFETVHASHVLEHIDDASTALTQWFRVLKVGGHLIINVPHQFLYEKKSELPSKWNKEHKDFYTPGQLLYFIERILTPNTYRVVYCRDNDWDFNYNIGPDQHSLGCYEIECVIKKIKPPTWSISEA